MSRVIHTYEGNRLMTRDYRGDVRCVIDDAGTLEESTSYYPYGMPHGTGLLSSVQPYKYTGKELDRETGLDWYDSQARMLDPATGRTTTMDPMAEKYTPMSPYLWCGGNPVNNIDLNGDTIIYKETQTYYYMQVGSSFGFYDANGNIYNGENPYVADLTAALRKIQSKPDGKALISAINNANTCIQIAKGTNKTDFNNLGVLWDPQIKEGGIDTEYSDNRPAFIGLAHELSHIWDKHKRITNGIWTALEGTSEPILNSEKYASSIENLIRSEHNIPLRKFYSKTAMGVPEWSTVILDKYNNNKFYTRQQLLQTLKQ